MARRVWPVTTFSAALVALGCTSEPPRDAPPGDRGVPAVSTSAVSTCVGSENAVDRAVCPRLLRDGCARAPLDRRALCRRLFVDLTGAAPTEAEAAQVCAGREPRAIAEALLASPAWERRAKALWAVELRYDPAQVDGSWLADADGLVAALARGELAYDDFARRILAHPVIGVGARLPRSDVVEDDARFVPQAAERAMRIFLGRAPIGDELSQLSALFRFWRKDIVVLNGDYGRAEVVVDPAECPCEADVLGEKVRVVLPLDHAMRFDDVPADRVPALREALDAIGAPFVHDEAFWTRGADIALAMFLGWWRSTSALDASTLPEVEVALARGLREHRSFRRLVLDVVSSTLYTRASELVPEAPEDAPLHCAGPMRVMWPEAFVASLGKALAVDVGRCDHRTPEALGVYYSNGSEGAFFPYALREDVPSDESLLGTREYQREATLPMGGCNAGAPRTEEPTLTWAFGAAPVATTLCSVSPALLPEHVRPESSAASAAGEVADAVAVRLLGRALRPDERLALDADAASACTAPCSARAYAELACAAIARSVPFVTY